MRRRELLASAGNFVNGYEYVDLGLPSGLKWTKCNIGANSEAECGDYYEWGGKHAYTGTSYGESIVGGDGDLDSYKYNDDVLYCLKKENDTANIVMGGDWRMPKEHEYVELIGYCEWYKKTKNGFTFESFNNGETLFFPTNGYYNTNEDNPKLNLYGSAAYLWSSTQKGTMGASTLVCSTSTLIMDSFKWHSLGVRGVIEI